MKLCPSTLTCLASLTLWAAFAPAQTAPAPAGSLKSTLPKEKLWALATCAILTEANQKSHDMLGGAPKIRINSFFWKENLAKSWNISSKEDLLEKLKWIETAGTRKDFDEMAIYLATLSQEKMGLLQEQLKEDEEMKNKVDISLKQSAELKGKSLLGWDYTRYISLCGWGYMAGFISEDEAWEKIMPAAKLLQKTFTSWEDLGSNYMIGCEFWSLKQAKENGERTRAAFKRVCANPASPWKKYEWNMKLD